MTRTASYTEHVSLSLTRPRLSIGPVFKPVQNEASLVASPLKDFMRFMIMSVTEFWNNAESIDFAINLTKNFIGKGNFLFNNDSKSCLEVVACQPNSLVGLTGRILRVRSTNPSRPKSSELNS